MEPDLRLRILAHWPDTPRLEPVVSVVPQPWPQPAPQLAETVAAMYRGKRERPLPVLVRDKLGERLSEQFAGAYGSAASRAGRRPALALVTIFQEAENLTGRQAVRPPGTPAAAASTGNTRSASIWPARFRPLGLE